MQPNFTEERIKELAAKWLNKNITPAEQKEFAEWYNRDQDAVVEIPSEFAASEEVLKNRILSKVNHDIRNDRKRSKPKAWLSAAASIILVAGIGGYYFQHQRFHKENVAKQTALPINDVLPGCSKATLTLSGGVKINLNSNKLGLVANQGKTQLKKNSEGQVIYEPQANNQSSALIYNTITVPKGGRYQVILSDSTKVWLNSASSITFPVAFSKVERRVSITGEVYLEVAKNKHLPFRVVAGKQTVEVLGTHFNINAYPDEPSIKTTLAEGKVKVITNNQTAILAPQQQAELSNDEAGKIMIHPVDVDNVLAWKSGVFQFDKAEISFIMREISRWYDVQIKFEGDVPNRKFTGSISRNVNLSEFLNMLSYTGLGFKTYDHVVIVSDK
ncbi:FecR family protein [Mucilaginibacter aquaedulcis]|uniref:FecR family protein n=1 Tax=Mucilaginibacter aquaedulcis TaxID=1187081 RepID=UPI0025B4E1AF|nr:FecR family protein [Mucilaginibacter aquaedulcis]MDN3549210.1 FecR family protein [Mucilaginibacter aquaedulcis]